jgi:putative addiction module killer protein
VSQIPYTIDMKIKIIFYKTETEKVPYKEWANDLDPVTKAKISARVDRLEDGYFGKCKPLKGYHGIHELVIDYGPGYRIYYGKQGSVIVILLLGGEKKTQTRDIEKAYRYWIDHTEEES